MIPVREPRKPSALEVFRAFLRLGCTSFGGPVAHLGYFQREFVEQREWLSTATFGEMVALSQSLPGPASSQLGFAIGLTRAGIPGGVAAWLGFTLPSAALMLAFAFWGEGLQSARGVAVLHGLQLVAVAVVAQAVLAMQRRLAPDLRRLFVAAAAAAMVLSLPSNVATVLAVATGGVLGRLFLDAGLLPVDETRVSTRPWPRRMGLSAASAFIILLIGALLFRSATLSLQSLAAAVYRVGAFVFGGGHVVLPLLAEQVVTRGWMAEARFLSGYGAAQALPGPLFSFAAYVGARVTPNAHPLLYGIVALCGIFLPGLLLMTAALPFWETIRNKPGLRSALNGINAATVGVLFAALLRPVISSTVHSIGDIVLAVTGFLLLALTRMPAWILVASMATFCWLRAAL